MISHGNEKKPKDSVVMSYDQILRAEDEILRKRIIYLIFPALILGNFIHLILIKKIIGGLCLVAVFVVRGTSLTTVLFGIKPVMDMTWDGDFFEFSLSYTV